MAYRDFISLIHTSTKRDYLARVTQRDKADVAEMAVKFDYDYWDGSRETGYGGSKNDGPWGQGGGAMGPPSRIQPALGGLDPPPAQGFFLLTFPCHAPPLPPP